MVTYASFRADSPPSAASRFGKGDRPSVEADCTNPGGARRRQGRWRRTISHARGQHADPGRPAARPGANDGAPVTTPFVSVPGLISTECVDKDGFHYLAVTVNADPADPRTDTIPGDVKVGNVILKDWGCT